MPEEEHVSCGCQESPHCLCVIFIRDTIAIQSTGNFSGRLENIRRACATCCRTSMSNVASQRSYAAPAKHDKLSTTSCHERSAKVGLRHSRQPCMNHDPKQYGTDVSKCTRPSRPRLAPAGASLQTRFTHAPALTVCSKALAFSSLTRHSS